MSLPCQCYSRAENGLFKLYLISGDPCLLIVEVEGTWIVQQRTIVVYVKSTWHRRGRGRGRGRDGTEGAWECSARKERKSAWLHSSEDKLKTKQVALSHVFLLAGKYCNDQAMSAGWMQIFLHNDGLSFFIISNGHLIALVNRLQHFHFIFISNGWVSEK